MKEAITVSLETKTIKELRDTKKLTGIPISTQIEQALKRKK